MATQGQMSGVQIIGLERARREIAKIAKDAPDVALRSVRAGAALLGEEMARRAPELSDDMAGTVGRSVAMVADGPTSVRVGPRHGLARTIEDGGEITPTSAQTLAFDDTFAERVVMPARPFVRPAVDERKAAAVERVRQSARRAYTR